MQAVINRKALEQTTFASAGVVNRTFDSAIKASLGVNVNKESLNAKVTSPVSGYN
jgi:hypothetical protein